MKAVKIINDPEAFQLLADDTRRKIIYHLRAKEMTVSQIASEMGLTSQAIYHHIRKLKDKDLVEIAKEERVGHFIETYYRATAEVFHLTHGGAKNVQDKKAEIKDTLEALGMIGFKVDCNPKAVGEIAKISQDLEGPCDDGKCDFDLTAVEDRCFATQQRVMEYANLLAMDDKAFEEFLKNYSDLRGALKKCATMPKSLAKPKAGKKKTKKSKKK